MQIEGTNTPRSRPIFIASVVALIFVTACLVYDGAHGFRSYSDLDLYYFGGVVETHGSYSNNAGVLAEAKRNHIIVTSSGVYGSPALVGLFYQPLSYLPIPVAHALWITLEFSCLLIAMRKSFGNYWPAWTALLFSTFGMELAHRWSNFHALTLAFIIYAFGALRMSQNKRAGAALGLAIAAKIYPVFLVVPLIAKRRWDAIKVSAIVVLVLGIVTVPALGWGDSIKATRFQLDIGGNVSSMSNSVSLTSFVQSVGHSATLAKVVTALMFIGGAVLILKMQRWSISVGISVAIVIMLLSQSITWAYYNTLLIIPLYVLWESRQPRVFLLGLFGFGLACAPGYAIMAAYDSSNLSILRITLVTGMVLMFAACMIAWLPKRSETSELV